MALGTPKKLLAAALSVMVATPLVWAAPAARRTEVRRLHQLESDLSSQFQRDHAAAVQWAHERGVPTRVTHPDGRVSALMFFRGGRPCTYLTQNAVAADSVSTDELWVGGSSGLDLDGSGVVLREWDGAEVRLTHQELAGAVTWADDTMYGYSSHSTHVAGTMVASGLASAARGMAPAATIEAYDFYDDNAEMAAAAAAGARLSNHSYGWIRGWYYDSSGDAWYWYGDPAVSATEDASFGFYDWTTQAWDEIAYDAPFYLILKSAGNDRNDYHEGGHYVYNNGWEWTTDARDADGGAFGYDTLSQQSCAKNILTVGAVDDVVDGYGQPDDVVMSSFSGWGPTDDGRIKPDIVADGIMLYSSVASSDTAYGWYSGTSMSTPNTTGSLALLIQLQRETHELQDMRAATLKGLVIHTADESGPSPGPDYSFGWGQLNTLRAAEYISLDQNAPEVIQELSLSEDQIFEQSWVYDGHNPIKATICWSDPPGTPVAASLDPPDAMLVNDLDLRIIDPDGVVHAPWRLDPAAPAAGAARGDNFRDNVEVVRIDDPIPGVYTIQVTHKGTLVNPPQDFSLIIAPPTAAPDPCGPNEILDCNGNCAPASWLGDGICDDGSSEYNGIPIDFSCLELDDDDGDCPGPALGTCDILWRDQLVGVTFLWLMNGNQRSGQGAVVTLDPAVWAIAGLGDFNGDGKTDILWRHLISGVTYIYLMDGAERIGQGTVVTLDPDVWAIAGVGDFDGDGRDDILWRHQGTGMVYLYLMNGTQRVGQGSVVTLDPTVWAIAGLGDFNRDGRVDILWRHLGSGMAYIYLMAGTQRLGQGKVVTLNPDIWSVVGLGDFDGDGRDDILWRNLVTGQTTIYLMDGTQKTAQGNVASLDPAVWAIDGIGDCNADGRCDILWRHQGTGLGVLYFMDGTEKSGQGNIGKVDLIWDVAGLGDFDGPP